MKEAWSDVLRTWLGALGCVVTGGVFWGTLGDMVCSLGGLEMCFQGTWWGTLRCVVVRVLWRTS